MGENPPATFPSQQLSASVPGHSAAQQHRPGGVEGALHLSAAEHWLMGQEHPEKIKKAVFLPCLCLQQARRSDCSPKLSKARVFDVAVQDVQASSNSSLTVAVQMSSQFYGTLQQQGSACVPPMFLIVSV